MPHGSGSARRSITPPDSASTGSRSPLHGAPSELRTALRTIGMVVHDQGTDRCGIVTATHPTARRPRSRRRSRPQNINVSTTFAGSARADMERRGLPSMVRMSVHCTTTGAEIERTIAAVARIV